MRIQMNENYQKKLDGLLSRLEPADGVKKLLLHSCCAPCSSYVLEYLSEFFEITIFYYNPNIYPESEYVKRVAEQQQLIEKMQARYPIHFQEGVYNREDFFAVTSGLEAVPEGGERCFRCYELRLRQAAEQAVAGGYDYFTTTLSISPMKNAAKLNEIGEQIGEQYGIKHLPADFKKRNGYKRSIELSKEYGLYRQDYCGCEYSFSPR